MFPVGYFDGYQGPYTPFGPPISQEANRNSEISQPVCIEEQCDGNRSVSDMHMDVDMDVDIGIKMEMELGFRAYAGQETEPSEPSHYTHIHTGDRILTLRIPYLGPVSWTVPARDGSQATRPFLIYQDPTAGFPSPPLPAEASKLIDEHVHLLASDDKENVADGVGEGEVEEEEGGEGDLPDRDAYVQDNMVAEAESIVELAAMSDGWNIWSLRSRPHHLDFDQGEYGYGFEYGHADNGHGYGMDYQYGHGYGFQRHQHNQQQDHQPEMEFNVTVGGSLEASPVRAQRAHSNSIVLVNSPRRTGRLDDGNVRNDGPVRWDGSLQAPSGFF
ncbi:hypothetical protein AJ78_03534 [Emergomyces pasteurianus Ep9510]|uniref:Uncharacterized protein n=1 Tax=Emergomyces pasteurianus Ep9510 TaxID=1447872 RepID=A0A1J9Q7R5_9EURO|nr:hypothetical protein AJ78_03534 [Emergomyces pasteurianus Ep9510]